MALGSNLKSKRNSFTGYLLVLAATVIWSFNFVVARGLSNSIPPVTLAFLRWATAVALMIPFAAKPLWRARRIVRQNLGYLSLCGVLAVTLFNTLVYIAGHTSAALNMSLIATSSPLFVVIFARLLFGEPITMGRLSGVLTATFGVILLVTNGKLSLLLAMTFSEGDLWMLLAAAIFAGYTILVKRMPEGLTQGVFLAAIFIIGLLCLVPWVLWERAGSGSVSFTTTTIIAIVYLGVGPSLLSYLCWNRAVELIGPARVSFVYYSLPVFSGLEAALILHESIGWVHILSGVLILFGIIVATRDPHVGRKRLAQPDLRHAADRLD